MRKFLRWLGFGLPLLALACTKAQLTAVETVATDIIQIATVLCLHDQSVIKGVPPSAVMSFCATETQLAPYVAIVSKASGPVLAQCTGSF